MTTLKIGQTVRDIFRIINGNFTELDQRKSFKVLYDGSVDIPAKADETSVTITLTEDLSNYDGVILQLEDCCAWIHFGDLSVGKVLKAVHNQFDMKAAMSGWNMFGYNCEVLSNKQLKLSGFIYSGSSFDKNEYFDMYELRYFDTYSVYPLTKVIGVKTN